MTVGEVDLSPLPSSARRQRRGRGGVGGGRVGVGREGGTGLIGVGEGVEREGGQKPVSGQRARCWLSLSPCPVINPSLLLSNRVWSINFVKRRVVSGEVALPRSGNRDPWWYSQVS